MEEGVRVRVRLVLMNKCDTRISHRTIKVGHASLHGLILQVLDARGKCARLQ